MIYTNSISVYKMNNKNLMINKDILINIKMKRHRELIKTNKHTVKIKDDK